MVLLRCLALIALMMAAYQGVARGALMPASVPATAPSPVSPLPVLPAPVPLLLSRTLPALVPAPATLVARSCPAGGLQLNRALRFSPAVDSGGFWIVRERWAKLGIAPPTRSEPADVRIENHFPHASVSASGERYSLDVAAHAVTIEGGSAQARFNALATLAQLPVRHGASWSLPCVSIVDAPALRWRIVSDDISRGPFPTRHYFHERIRTLASLKINGWSPYMEQVFADPIHPYVAFPNVLTAADLRELTCYAQRYHIAIVPQQQTLAHMHETLKYEQLASLAELPHGYLMAPGAAGTLAYIAPLIAAEIAAAGRPPLFHIGADEPIDLGRGRTPRAPQVFADHVNGIGAFVTANGSRPMIWDDAVQQYPTLLTSISKRTVIVTFHYGAEPSFTKYIAPIAAAGFDQLISPGANNWNEIYPDLQTAYDNAARFIADGQAAGVLGMFETVWHDDGETLFESSWAPVAFAAAGAWQARPVDRQTWHSVFARMFFGSEDAGFAGDLDALERIRGALRTAPAGDSSDYLFWSDPFDRRIAERMRTLDLVGTRNSAETVLTHLAGPPPPLHSAAAAVMRLAALRYDTLARRFQIGAEARDYYADARAHVGLHDDATVYRGLNVAKYLCWELRDQMTALAPLYARAWRYESSVPGLDRVLVRYRLAAERAVIDADRLNAGAREDYLRGGSLPPFETLMERAN